MTVDLGLQRRRRPPRFRLLHAIGLCFAVAPMTMAGIVAAQPVAEDHRPAAEASGKPSAGSGDAAGERAQSFVAVEGAVQEEVAGGPLLLGAYALVWLFLLAYVIVLARRTSRTEQEVARLADLLRRHPG